MTTTYVQGGLLRLTATFKNVKRYAADPDTVTLRVENPAGTVTSYTYAAEDLVKDGVGIYYYDLDLDTPGQWFYRFEGTGDCQAAAQGGFTVTAERPAA